MTKKYIINRVCHSIFGFFALVPSLCMSQLSLLNPVENYGWLDQYSMDSRHHYVGNEACVPTSSTNGLTYLQNTVPFIFGNNLSGTTYADWEATDDLLIHLMGTTTGAGTYYNQFVYALENYVHAIKGYPQVQFSGQFPSDNWDAQYPQPNFISGVKPTIPFLTNAIAAGSAVLLSIEYDNGDGHELLVNGLEWDPVTLKGKLYFIDPLDPSQNYSPDVPLGPVKQTSGKLKLSEDGTKLILEYDQYAGRLPYDGSYSPTKVSLSGVLSVGSAAFTPFSSLLPNGNAHDIAVGFDAIDPTTAEMFPVMAVFNTLSEGQLENAFDQMDPSAFNPLMLEQQEVALRLHDGISNNFLDYRRWGCEDECGCGLRLWGAPFHDKTHQDGRGSLKGYQACTNGWLGGADYCECGWLLGAGLSYSSSHLDWSLPNFRATIKGCTALVYAAKTKGPFWMDVSFGYSRNKVKARRIVAVSTSVPYIAPVYSSLRHQDVSPCWSGHLRLAYEVWGQDSCCYELAAWPYLGVYYAGVSQPGYCEKGGPIFAYHVSKQRMHMLRPELGLGGSLLLSCFSGYVPYGHALIGYTKDWRFGGKETRAYFRGLPETRFEVEGLYPQLGLFIPKVILGIKSPGDLFRFHIVYDGAYGSGYTSNELGFEISLMF